MRHSDVNRRAAPLARSKWQTPSHATLRARGCWQSSRRPHALLFTHPHLPPTHLHLLQWLARARRCWHWRCWSAWQAVRAAAPRPRPPSCAPCNRFGVLSFRTSTGPTFTGCGRSHTPPRSASRACGRSHNPPRSLSHPPQQGAPVTYTRPTWHKQPREGGELVRTRTSPCARRSSEHMPECPAPAAHTRTFSSPPCSWRAQPAVAPPWGRWHPRLGRHAGRLAAHHRAAAPAGASGRSLLRRST